MENSGTKDKIRSIATQLFAQKGYDAVGVQEIVDTAEITKPTLYYYFGSKVGLLQSIVETNMTDFLNQLKAASNYEHQFFDSLKKIIYTVMTYAKNNPDFFRFYVTLLNAPEDSEMRQVFRPYHKDIFRTYFDFFIKSTQEFGNMRGKEGLYATLFHTNVTAVSMMVARGDLIDDEQTIYRITHSFIYGFAD